MGDLLNSAGPTRKKAGSRVVLSPEGPQPVLLVVFPVPLVTVSGDLVPDLPEAGNHAPAKLPRVASRAGRATTAVRACPALRSSSRVSTMRTNRSPQGASSTEREDDDNQCDFGSTRRLGLNPSVSKCRWFIFELRVRPGHDHPRSVRPPIGRPPNLARRTPRFLISMEVFYSGVRRWLLS